MRVVNLASGSKGNVTFFEAGGVKILIDVGLTLKDLKWRLELINEKLENIDAILVTHEHSDHIRGLLSVLKACKARFYAPKSVVDFLKLSDEAMGRVSVIGDYEFHIGDVTILSFHVPHDAKETLAFVLENEGRKVGIATDLGFVPTALIENFTGCEIVYIESNHDRNMLMSNSYPRFVKLRIASDRGHLSNEQAAAAITSLAKRGTKYFILSHISEHSNTISLAYLASAKALEKAGYTLEKDVFLRYSRQDRPGNNFIFGENNE